MSEFALLFILAFAAIVFVFALVSRRLEGSVVTPQMVFVAAGLLLSPAGLDLIEPAGYISVILIVAEIALVLTLFADAAGIDFAALRHGRGCPSACSSSACRSRSSSAGSSRPAFFPGSPWPRPP